MMTLRTAVVPGLRTPTERLERVRRRMRLRQRAHAALAATVAAAAAGTVAVGVAGLTGQDGKDVAVLSPAASGAASPGPSDVPRLPRRQMTPDTPPGPATIGQTVSGAWTLRAVSDDDQALLIEAVVPTCSAYDGVSVDETADSVTVVAKLRAPGSKAVCISNTPTVASLRVLVTLTSPLSDRTLLQG
jgi:hypothetical protein